MPVRVGTASPGTARFPSHYGRLGCMLRGGTCACQMLFSLSFPNLLISFRSEQQKACQSQNTSSGSIFFRCVVISTLYFMCKLQKIRNVFSCFNCPLCILEALFPCLLVSFVLKFEKKMWSFTVSSCCLGIINFVNGHCTFVFKRVSVL